MSAIKRTFSIFITIILFFSILAVLPLPENTAQAAQPFTVILNPGHGPASTGSGAVAGGIKESVLNEQLTEKVASKLKARGINVVVTNKMTSVSNPVPYLLDETPKNTDSPGQYSFSTQLLPVIQNPSLRIAGMETPNLLITLHHNSTVSSSVRGYEVYYCSKLTPDYNKTSDTVARSRDFANMVDSQFNQAGFYLARRGVFDVANNSLTTRPAVPSVLVEAGYMSNSSDLSAIRSGANQDILADRLANAVVEYRNKYGNSYPAGTTPVTTSEPTTPIKAGSVTAVNNTPPSGTSLTAMANNVTGGTGGIKEVSFAVWPTGRQALLKWYSGVSSDGNNYSITANMSDFGNITGAYDIHVYAKDTAGNEKGIGTAKVYLGAASAAMKAQLVSVTKNSDGVSLTAKANNVTGGTGGIKEVNFAVWPTGRQDLLKWYKGSTADGKNFSINANMRDLGNIVGNYTVHVYAKDYTDNNARIGAGNVSLGSVPKADSVKVTKNGDGVSFTAAANNVTGGAGGIKEVNFAIWPVGRQDLMKWYKGSSKDGKNFSVNVNMRDLGNIIGNYTVHVYAKDYNNTDTPIGGGTVSLGSVPKAASTTVAKKSDVALTATATNVTGGAGGIKEVNFAVWPTGKQNLMKWYKGSSSDGKNFSINASVSDFGYAIGNYTVHIYAKDYNNTDTSLGAGSVNLGSAIKSQKVTVTKDSDGVSLTANAANVTGGYSGIKEVNFAIWPAGRQDLMKWYKGSSKDGKNFSINANMRDLGNIIGNYTVHVYATDNVGNQAAIGGGSVSLGSVPKAASVKVSKNSDGASLIATANNVTGGAGGIKELNFAVWPAGRKDLMKWYKGSSKDGKNFSVNVNMRDLGNIIGNYTVHVYAKDYNNTDTSIGAGTVSLGSVPKAASTNLVKNSDGISLKATASNVTGGAGGIKEVNFAVWPTNDKNAMKWYKGSVSGGNTYSVNASIKDFSNKSGEYTVHIYAKDYANKDYSVGSGKISLGSPITPVKSGGAKISVDSNPNSATLVVSNVTGGTGGVKEVNFAVWPTSDSGKMKWIPATRIGSDWTANINISQFGNIFGNYTVHVYAIDNNGDQYGIATAKADLGGKVNTVTTDQSVYETSRMTCYIRPGFAAKEVNVAVWSENNGQDDIKWLSAKYDASTGQWIATTDLSTYSSAGKFLIHAYADGNKFINSTTVTVKASAFDGYKIMGASSVTAQQLANYITSKGWSDSWYNMTALQFAQEYIDICRAEGVKAEVAFAQMCLETNNLQFTATVSRDQNNFAGLGTTSSTVKGIYFKSVSDGIKSQVQHLKRYASTESFNLSIAPEYTRYTLVTPGCAPTVEMLSGKWATGPDYGAKILNIIDQILKTSAATPRMRVAAAPAVQEDAIAVMSLDDDEFIVEEIEESALAEPENEIVEEIITDADGESEETLDAVLTEDIISDEIEFIPLEPEDSAIPPDEDKTADNTDTSNTADLAQNEKLDATESLADTSEALEEQPSEDVQTNITLIYFNPQTQAQEQNTFDVSGKAPETTEDALYAAIAKLAKADAFKTEVLKTDEVDDSGILKVYLSKPVETAAALELDAESAAQTERAALAALADVYLYYIGDAKQIEFVLGDAPYSSVNLKLEAGDTFKELLLNIIRG